MGRISITQRSLFAAVPLTLSACVGTGRSGPAVESAPVDRPAATAQSQDPRPFVPPAPPPTDRADWIKLTSGEWLRGELLAMRQEELEFDSDKLDEQTFDWEDVAEVRTSRSFSVLFANGLIYEGPLHILGDDVHVSGGTQHGLRRADLEAFVHTSERESDRWSGKLSLGITQRTGNTEQTDFTSYGLLRRETPWTRFENTYTGAYSRVNTQAGSSVQTANNHRISSRFDWYLSRLLYVTGGVEAFRDPFQNIDHRITPYIAIGYDVFDTRRVSWSVSAGPAYQRTRLDSVTPPDEATDDTVAAVFQSRFDWDIDKNIEFHLDYNVTVPLPESQEYNHHLAAILSIDLTSALDLDVQWVWDRTNDPTLDDSGIVPEKDDFRLSINVGYDF